MSIEKSVHVFFVGLLIFSANLHAAEVKHLKEIDNQEIEKWLSQPRGVTRSMRPESRALEFQVNFDFNSHKVSADDQYQIKRLANVIRAKSRSDQRFTVEGHTDRKGSHEYNLALSTRRANEVKSILMQEGIEDARLSAIGKSFTDLINREQPFSGENRRVRVVLSTK